LALSDAIHITEQASHLSGIRVRDAERAAASPSKLF